VFLFAGPTGTGKTEIAKTLAEFLFGSPSRMIRIDMSELKSPESLARLVGDRTDPREGPGASLVDEIRKNPFSVVLLDEFEKAHAQVWDLFLQVFDDGRLTDSRGITADFRHAIVIMTSNLGGIIASGLGLGFHDVTGAFSPQAVERVVGKAFRKEFLNRIDRTVVFRPLSREIMRDILRKELKAAFQRRGLRHRTWAVEWDESALDFLLDRGFTADLGARPLKRAIDRWLLAPLAQTIVAHQYPEGDQFLIVRAGGDRLSVTSWIPTLPRSARGGLARARSLARARGDRPRSPGTPGDLEQLHSRLHALTVRLEVPAWRERKEALYAGSQARGFWEDPSRFRTLGAIEYVDRIETGVEAARSLLDRLQGGGRRSVRRDLVGHVAQKIFLVESALAGLDEGAPSPCSCVSKRGGRGPGAGRTAAPSRSACAACTQAGRSGAACSSRSWSLASSRCPASGAVGCWRRNPDSTCSRCRGMPGTSVARWRGCRCSATGHAAVAARGAGGPGDRAAGRRRAAALGGAALSRDAIAAGAGRGEGWRTGLLDRVLEGDFDLLARVVTPAAV
jgi:ATP-dependent Clp protease ATP-binding subunit ClpC